MVRLIKANSIVSAYFTIKTKARLKAMLRRLPHTLFPKISRLFLRRRAKTISYQKWVRQQEFTEKEPEISNFISKMVNKPHFSIIIDARCSAGLLSQTLKSVNNQIYHYYDVLSFDSEQQRQKILQQGLSGDYIVLLKPGQLLSHRALFEFSKAINEAPERDLVYGDHDTINRYGRRSNPFYKPDWSPDYLETFNYIGFIACFRASMAKDCLSNTSYYDFVLQFTERTQKISHVRQILGHDCSARFTRKVVRNEMCEDIEALQGRLGRTGRNGIVREHPYYRGCYEIDIELKNTPLVSIVIPTAGVIASKKSRQIDLITNLVKQIRERSTYKNIEIIVVDNGDLSESQQLFLKKYNCKQITFSEKKVNISAKLNLGVTLACGELLLLMNDDIEVISPRWIERMVEHFEKEHVGVVGAKLLYPSGLIQHVGVAFRAGYPDHVRGKYFGNEAGYFYSTCGVRNYSGVTGAVMMTRTALYRQLGGYAEVLAINYNDMEYCFKVRNSNYQVVYAPRAALIHMESESRNATTDMNVSSQIQEEHDWFGQRWADRIAYDPYYNPKFLVSLKNIPSFEVCFKKRGEVLSKQ